MSETLRIGTLGAAKITPLALLRPAAVIPAVSVTAVAASSPDKARAFAADHGIEHVYDSYDALVDAPDIDIVYNPLPINRHADLSIRALEAGKHVLCEKPFVMNSSEAVAVLDAARRSGRRVVEAFHYRYHPAFDAFLQLIADGRIGSVTAMDAQFTVGIPYDPREIRHRKDTGGGAMMDLGCYPLSWALMVAGEEPEVTDAQATLSRGGVDESLRCELRFPGGIEARLHCSMAEGLPFSASLRVSGSDGTIEFDNPLHPHGGGRLLVSGAERQLIPISPISTYTWQLAALVEALRSGTALPTEGDIILRQQRALDAVYAAAGLGALRNGA